MPFQLSPSPSAPKKPFSFYILLTMALLGIGGCLVGYGLDILAHWPSCRLCHMERWTLLAWGISAVLSIKRIRWHGGLLMLSVLGSILAGYHTALQFHWLRSPAFCRIDTADSFAAFMSQPTAMCHEWTLTIVGLPAPLYLWGMWTASAWWIWRCLRSSTSARTEVKNNMGRKP